MNYEERVVGFIDILGFKDKLTKTIDKKDNDVPERITEIIHVYEEIQNIWKTESRSLDLNTRKVSIFSDCIVVSFKASEPAQIFTTLVDVKNLIMALIARGILCRGALCWGKLLHTEQYLFGPALVEAYTLESKAALYPRVILDRDLVNKSVEYVTDQAEQNREIDDLLMLLNKDTDGMYYIDYFFKAQMALDRIDKEFPSYVDNLRKLIADGLKRNSHSSRAAIKIKYLWMRERFNNMVKEVQSTEYLSSTKSYVSDDLYFYFKSLKEISPNRFARSDNLLSR